MDIDNNIRNNNITLFNKLISPEKSKEIENSIYNFSIEYANINNTPSYILLSIYETKINEIYDLLINKKYIVLAINNNELITKNIAYMKPEELDPDKYESIIKKKELEEYKKNNEGSNTFTCSKCKESKVNITQKQTRAGDEPPTIFVSCLNCGHTFKF